MPNKITVALYDTLFSLLARLNQGSIDPVHDKELIERARKTLVEAGKSMNSYPPTACGR